MCGPLCWPWANKKPAEEKILAGHTCPRPFSYLFYVASKPAGSNDHGIDVVIRSARLPVKAPVGVDRRSEQHFSAKWEPVRRRKCDNAKTSHREASMPPTNGTQGHGTKGILPDHRIAELAKSGGIRPAREFAPDQI